MKDCRRAFRLGGIYDLDFQHLLCLLPTPSLACRKTFLGCSCPLLLPGTRLQGLQLSSCGGLFCYESTKGRKRERKEVKRISKATFLLLSLFALSPFRAFVPKEATE